MVLTGSADRKSAQLWTNSTEPLALCHRRLLHWWKYEYSGKCGEALPETQQMGTSCSATKRSEWLDEFTMSVENVSSPFCYNSRPTLQSLTPFVLPCLIVAVARRPRISISKIMCIWYESYTAKISFTSILYPQCIYMIYIICTSFQFFYITAIN